MLTTKQFEELYPRCKDPEGWVNAMNDVFPKYDIDTPKRVASFIAQCGHESAGWRYFSENLNYSEKALNAVFSKYFSKAGRDAGEYARQPEKIANIVYASRMGNGDTESGDGWKFRGRGPIQLTGHNNYSSFSDDMGVDVTTNPDIVSEDKKISLMSAIWFWNKNGLNKYADSGDIKTMTRRINGGYIGLEDRIEHYNHALKLLGDTNFNNDEVDNDEEIDLSHIGVLRRGSRGDGVKLLQEGLGITADGVFGPGTERVLKQWQRDHNIEDDGIAGPITLGLILDDDN